MSTLRVFEIHTYRGGSWRIDSVFDDRDLAMMEADRIERSRRYSGVRVIEETFNDETQRGATRTVYRSSKADRINAANRVRQEAPIKTPPPPPRKAPAQKKKGVVRQLIIACFVLCAIAGGGLTIIYFLNTLSTGH